MLATAHHPGPWSPASTRWPSLSFFVLQVLDEFSKQVDRIEWPVGSPATIHYTALDGYLSAYQVGLLRPGVWTGGPRAVGNGKATVPNCCGSGDFLPGWISMSGQKLQDPHEDLVAVLPGRLSLLCEHVSSSLGFELSFPVVTSF